MRKVISMRRNVIQLDGNIDTNILALSNSNVISNNTSNTSISIETIKPLIISRPTLFTQNITVDNSDLTVNGTIKCNELITNKTTENTTQTEIISSIPTGSINAFIMEKAPDGWLLCDGSEYNKKDYPKLYDLIKNTFGGSNDTFIVPDLRGRTIIGCGEGFNILPKTFGVFGGEERHILSLNELPTHSHLGETETIDDHNHFGSTNNAGDHTHIYNDGYYSETTELGKSVNGDVDSKLRWHSGENTTTMVGGNHVHTFVTKNAGSHSHKFITENVGESDSHNNMQPYLVLSYIIKT